jgi:hypothetical protein
MEMGAIVLVLAMIGSPAEELRCAVLDVASRVPVEERHGMRYASFYSVPEEERGEAAAALNFVLNTVSRSKQIIAIEEVPDTERRLWRIRWDRYELPRDAWESLASEDPYWHQRLQLLDQKKREAREVFVDGMWLPPDDVAALRTHTGSAGAILRGDFLIARMSTTLNGGHYYRLADIAETEQEFFRDLGIDAKTIGKLGADAGANLVYSRVTHQVRRVVRRPGPLGGAWHTYDVERSLAENDPLRNPFDFRYDAGEHIAAAPNGLHRFALYDAKGKRQDSVPDTIAKDTSDPHGAGIVVPMLSCVRCHVEDGLRPFTNDQAKLLSGDVDLLAPRPRDAERLADFYGSDLATPLQRDREDYAAAVAKATGGLSVKDAAAALAKQYSAYTDDLVTTEKAAREVGVTSEELVSCLRESNDAVLLMLSEGIAVQREQWAASFAEAASLAAKHFAHDDKEQP